MPDKKITELTPLSIVSSADVFPIVDVSATETKKVTVSDLMGSPGPIGMNNASNARFTSLRLSYGTSINEFSIDGSLSGNSDDVIPTEKAVKTYVDTQGVHNNLLGLQGGDSTSSEFYHLTKDIHDGLFSGSPLIGLGNHLTTNWKVDYGAHTIVSNINGTEEFRLDSGGMSLKTGTSVNNISTDGNLGSSDNILVTQKAIKTYVDAVVTSGEVVKRISTDTTAVILDALLVDTTAGNVTVTLDVSQDGRMSVKKITSDANQVIITSSSKIDGKNQYIINTPYQAYSFLVDSGEVFIF